VVKKETKDRQKEKKGKEKERKKRIKKEKRPGIRITPLGEWEMFDEMRRVKFGGSGYVVDDKDGDEVEDAKIEDTMMTAMMCLWRRASQVPFLILFLQKYLYGYLLIRRRCC
jgi:hypothetical protein